jgi:hypothetical protein
MNVGRSKRTWRERLDQRPTESMISLLAKKALMSSEVEAVFTEDLRGSIMVGGFRLVGTFTLTEEPSV